jgi:hypothetical protein
MNLEVGSCAYNEVKKARFHREGGALLRKVAKLLRLKPEEYEIRWNAAGIAVSGDWTLHAGDVYVQINLEIDWVLVRTCKGRKDYTGGPTGSIRFPSCTGTARKGWPNLSNRFGQRRCRTGKTALPARSCSGIRNASLPMAGDWFSSWPWWRFRRIAR